MSHLASERLAALADDEPLAAEARHLAACAECAHERDAHRRLLVRARQLGTQTAAPLTSWDSLAKGLADGGLLRHAGQHRPRTTLRFVAQLAAALVLIVGGTAFGRVSAGAPLAPWHAPAAPTASNNASAPSYANEADAMATYLRAQSDLQSAAAFLAARDPSLVASEPQVISARLGALDQIAAAARSAVANSPYDPMTLQYLQSIEDERAANLRQLVQVVPVGTTLIKY